jgi:hypothetical protein
MRVIMPGDELPSHESRLTPPIISAVLTIDELGPWDAFWCAVGLNFTASCLGLVVVMNGHFELGFLIPFVCTALTGLVAIGALLPRRTRRLGGGGLGGLAVSIVGFVAVVVAAFVGYFLIGGHELS